MTKKLAILTLMWCLWASPQAQQNRESQAVLAVVKRSNDLQVDALKAPTDKAKVAAADDTIAPDSPAAMDWDGTLNRYLADPAHPVHLLSASHHVTKLDGDVVFTDNGRTASLSTKEDIYRISSSGRVTILTDVPETYIVKKMADGTWRIYDNQVSLAQGAPVRWEKVSDQSWNWNRCWVAILPGNGLSLVTEEPQDDLTTLVESVVISVNGTPTYTQHVNDPRRPRRIPDPETSLNYSRLFDRDCADAIRYANAGSGLPDEVLKLFRGLYDFSQK